MNDIQESKLGLECGLDDLKYKDLNFNSKNIYKAKYGNSHI